MVETVKKGLRFSACFLLPLARSRSRPLAMGCTASLSVVSQLLSVCVPSGSRPGWLPSTSYGGARPRVDRKGRTRTGNQGGSFHYPLTGQSSAKLSYLPAKPVFPGRHSFFCLLGSWVEGKSHQSPGGKDWIQTSKQTVSPRLPRSISVPSLNSGPDNPSSGPASIRTAELTRASIYSPVAATWNRMVAAECRLKRTMLRMTPDATLL